MNWPKLSWVAHCRHNSITLHHGRSVETGHNWAFEGVWAGSYEAADFDRRDVVHGSGVRIRGEKAYFVPPSHSLERLYYVQSKSDIYVSNSLAALAANAELSWDYSFDYAGALTSINRSDRDPVLSLPTANESRIHILFYDNWQYDGLNISISEKPLLAPAFDKYQDLINYLHQMIDSIGENMTSKIRKHTITPVTTMSSGYDSNAISALARRIGCNQGWTHTHNMALGITHRDSGKKIGSHLGIALEEIPRKHIRDEYLVWASNGLSSGLPNTVFDFPSNEITLLFTGNHAGILWAKGRHSDASLFRSDTGGTAFAEFRLHKGFFHCPFAFTGVKRAKDIEDISFSDDMKPWSLNRKRYDRPIPRRILEEAGVPGKLFGQKKIAGAGAWVVFWPQDRQHRKELRQYLLEHNFPIARTWGPIQNWVDSFKMSAHTICKHFLKVSPFARNYINIPQTGHMLWSLDKIIAENYTDVRSTDRPL